MRKIEEQTERVPRDKQITKKKIHDEGKEITRPTKLVYLVLVEDLIYYFCFAFHVLLQLVI